MCLLQRCDLLLKGIPMLTYSSRLFVLFLTATLLTACQNKLPESSAKQPLDLSPSTQSPVVVIAPSNTSQNTSVAKPQSSATPSPVATPLPQQTPEPTPTPSPLTKEQYVFQMKCLFVKGTTLAAVAGSSLKQVEPMTDEEFITVYEGETPGAGTSIQELSQQASEKGCPPR